MKSIMIAMFAVSLHVLVPPARASWSPGGVEIVDVGGTFQFGALATDGAYLAATQVSGDVRLQRISMSGARTWGAQGKGVEVDPAVFSVPRELVPTADGGCVIAWSNENSFQYQAVVARFDANGVEMWRTALYPYNTETIESMSMVLHPGTETVAVGVVVRKNNDANSHFATVHDVDGISGSARSSTTLEDSGWTSSIELSANLDGVVAAWDKMYHNKPDSEAKYRYFHHDGNGLVALATKLLASNNIGGIGNVGVIARSVHGVFHHFYVTWSDLADSELNVARVEPWVDADPIWTSTVGISVVSEAAGPVQLLSGDGVDDRGVLVMVDNLGYRFDPTGLPTWGTGGLALLPSGLHLRDWCYFGVGNQHAGDLILRAAGGSNDRFFRIDADGVHRWAPTGVASAATGINWSSDPITIVGYSHASWDAIPAVEGWYLAWAASDPRVLRKPEGANAGVLQSNVSPAPIVYNTCPDASDHGAATLDLTISLADPAFRVVSGAEIALGATELVADHPEFFPAAPTADAALVHPGYSAGILHRAVGGCGMVSIELVGTSLPGDQVEIRSCDMNGDGVVNSIDHSRFSQAYYSDEPEAYPCADFNGDGTLTIQDVSKFGAHFGHSFGSAKYDPEGVSSAPSGVVLQRGILAGVRGADSVVLELPRSHPGRVGLTEDGSYFAVVPKRSGEGTTVLLGIAGGFGREIDLRDVLSEDKVDRGSIVRTDGTSGSIEIDRYMARSDREGLSDVRSFPNPANPRATIAFRLERTADVELRVFDLRGRIVGSEGPIRFSAGDQQLVWGGVDASGRSVASGVYVYELRTESDSQRGRLMLLK